MGNPHQEKKDPLREAMKLCLGEYPDGKLGPNDLGAVACQVGTRDGRVLIEFAKPVAFIGLPPQLAVDMAIRMIAHARVAARLTGQVLTFNVGGPTI